MHMFQAGDTIFNFNSDGSGDVRIQRADDLNYASSEQLSVPMAHVFEFVAHFVKSQQISQIEDQNWEKVLGLE